MRLILVRPLRHVLMTADEYFDEHIPHRVNLLVAFRTRYSGSESPQALSPERYRDLFRCAKDMSLLMTRFFCGELGVFYCEKTQQIEDAQKWSSRFGSTRVPALTFRSDSRYSDLCQMYQAANQAVAHIDSNRVAHSFRIAADDQRMFAVIEWLKELVAEHIYAAAGRDFTASMQRPSNIVI
jgi:hypothetical protein